METILNEYNKFGATHLSTMQELEAVSEIIHSEIVGRTSAEILLIRFFLFNSEDNKHLLHRVSYYALDVGKLDINGDVKGLTPVEYGLL